MNREELVRVVLWQFAAIVVTALGSWIGFGSGAGLSAMFGGLCVAVPNAMFALCLLRSIGSKKPIAPALILLGELLKIFVIMPDSKESKTHCLPTSVLQCPISEVPQHFGLNLSRIHCIF